MSYLKYHTSQAEFCRDVFKIMQDIENLNCAAIKSLRLWFKHCYDLKTLLVTLPVQSLEPTVAAKNVFFKKQKMNKIENKCKTHKTLFTGHLELQTRSTLTLFYYQFLLHRGPKFIKHIQWAAKPVCNTGSWITFKAQAINSLCSHSQQILIALNMSHLDVQYLNKKMFFFTVMFSI